MIFTRSFWQAAFERALKAAAWTLSSLLIADGTDILGTDWTSRLSVAGMAGVLSLLGSIASSGVGGTGPSLANEVISPPAVDPADRGEASLWIIAGALVVVAFVAVFGRP